MKKYMIYILLPIVLALLILGYMRYSCSGLWESKPSKIPSNLLSRNEGEPGNYTKCEYIGFSEMINKWNRKNQITITSKVTLTVPEKEQLVNSVDAFMSEYKLPKGVKNSYALSIEKRLNDAIEVIINPGEEGDIGNLIIHARKTNNVWQVDPNSGPWCTLKEFEQKTCF